MVKMMALMVFIILITGSSCRNKESADLEKEAMEESSGGLQVHTISNIYTFYQR